VDVAGTADGVDTSALPVHAEGDDGVPAEARPRRADAVKNRRRILEAAEEVFAAHGVSAPVDLVAEQAGVGVGTLYRHFPTKESLIEAIVVTRVQDLAAATAGFADAPEPGEAFFAFLRQFARQASNKRDLFDALGDAGVDVKARCASQFAQLERGIDGLLHRAEAAGAVRDDITTNDVIGLVAGACMATERSGIDAGCFERMVEIVCDGLRPPPR